MLMDVNAPLCIPCKCTSPWGFPSQFTIKQTKVLMTAPQGRGEGGKGRYHSRTSLEPGTTGFSTPRINHYATRGVLTTTLLPPSRPPCVCLPTRQERLAADRSFDADPRLPSRLRPASSPGPTPCSTPRRRLWTRAGRPPRLNPPPPQLPLPTVCPLLATRPAASQQAHALCSDMLISPS